MQKSEQRMKAICDYIEEYQFEYPRIPRLQGVAHSLAETQIGYPVWHSTGNDRPTVPTSSA